MSEPRESGPASSRNSYPGGTHFTSGALHSLARAVAGEVLRIDAEKVAAAVRDDGGALVITLKIPAELPNLGKNRINDRMLRRLGGDLVSRGTQAQRRAQERFCELSGREVLAVDIEFTNAAIGRGRWLA